MPGPDFSFLKRHQNTLSNKMCQNIKRARAKVDHNAINLYFDELNQSMERVLPHSVINYDETNITDDPGCKKVVVRRGCRHPGRIIHSSRSSTSVMFAAAGNGTLLPPHVKYKAKNLNNTWTEHGPKGTVYNRSKRGWLTLEIFEDWFRKIAMPYFSKQDKEGKKVMIGDNLASHISSYIIEECKKKQHYLPPNSTGLTQPLDVAFFRPLNIKWREALESWKAKNRGTIPKDTFSRILKKCLEEMGMKNISKNVMSRFKGAGLVPLNREEVLKRLPGEKAVEEGKENDNAFQEYLERRRRKETDGLRKQTIKKLNVPAGRGICEEDIVILEDNPKKEKRKRKQLVEDQSVINKEKLTKKTQKTRKVLESSESDEDSCSNEVVLEDSSDDDWVSFRAKHSMNIEDHIEDNIDDNIGDNNQESIYSQPSLQSINEQVGSFIIVCYDSNFYPGVIEKLDDKGSKISAMTKTIRKNWKWPEHKDEFYYGWQDIVGGINPPTALNERGLIMVVCAQLSILNDSLMNIRHFAELEVGHEFRDDNGRNEISPRLQDTMNRKLAECVVHHRCILEFTDEFQALFSNSILGQFIVSVIIICITMFEMTLTPIGSMQFFSMVLYQYCMLLEIFLWCYYGNEVILKTRMLTESAYKSDWVPCCEEYRKNILFIMLRTQKDTKIQAGMFFTLSLSTFVKILKSSWSYFAVLLNVNE